MIPGDRLTLLFDEHEHLVRTSAPYGLRQALEHLELLEPEIAGALQVVVVEVVGVPEALARSERDTLPAPPPPSEAAELKDELPWR